MIWFSACLAALGSLPGLIVLPALYVRAERSVTFLVLFYFGIFLLGISLSISIPWPFPPVWGVADNTKE